MPLLVPLLWLHHADGLPGNMCVDAAFVLRAAYAQFGLRAELMPVDLVIANTVTGRTIRHGEPNPGWKDGQFTGHCVLRLPGSARFVDVTAEQYPQVARLRFGPVIGRMTHSTGPVDASRPMPPGSVFTVQRSDLNLAYTVSPEGVLDGIENHPKIAEFGPLYRRAGINLASHALVALRHPEVIERARRSPYPRLHALLDAITDESDVDDSRDWRFVVPDDTRQPRSLRLDEIPLPPGTPTISDHPTTPALPTPVAIGEPRPVPLSEHHFLNGWDATPTVRIRPARPADIDALARLAHTAGTDLEDELAQAVTEGRAGTALAAGLRGGHNAFARSMAERFADNPGGITTAAYLSAALVLVAEETDDTIVGALIAYPPPNIASVHLDHARDPHERAQTLMVGGIAIAKLTAVAVAENARGRGIGSTLVDLYTQIYTHCGYFILYGQIPAATSGLDTFYRNRGFNVLDEDGGIDMWVAFGVHSHIYPDPGGRMFHRHPRSRATE